MNHCAECERKYSCERSTFYHKGEDGRNDKPMKKLSKILNDILHAYVPAKQFKKYNLTQYQCKELFGYYEHLRNGKNLLVLDSGLSNLLEKCGFEVLPLGDDGVGWFVR